LISQHADREIEFWKTNKHETVLDYKEFATKYGGKNFEYMLRTCQEARVQTGLKDNLRDYIASKWAAPFHLDTTSSVKGLKAPVGTGKTSAVCIEIQRLACLQFPDVNGVRWFKALIIRGSYYELKTTVLDTWRHWAPPSICKIVTSPYIRANMEMALPDGTTVNLEVEFMSVPDLKTAKEGLKGKEPTVIYINELPEITQPIQVIQECESRLWRFPSVTTAPIRWSGILFDFNPSVIGGPVYKFFKDQEKIAKSKPDEPREVSLYEYPPALIRVPARSNPEDYAKSQWVPNPEADYHRFNNIGFEYWFNMVNKYANDEDYIRKNVEGFWTLGTGNKSCFPSFSQKVHVGDTIYDPSAPVLVGADGGLFPAIVIGQLLAGCLHVQHEVIVDEITVSDLVTLHLLPLIKQHYPTNARKIVYHDPGNNNRSPNSMEVNFKPTMLWRQKGFEVGVINNMQNKTDVRHRAVSQFLNIRNALVINTRCEYLTQAMAGRYQWNMPKNDEPSTKTLQPVKDRFADVADAFQYLCVGVGDTSGINAYSSPKDIVDQWGTPLAPDTNQSNYYPGWDDDDAFDNQSSGVMTSGFLYV